MLSLALKLSVILSIGISYLDNPPAQTEASLEATMQASAKAYWDASSALAKLRAEKLASQPAVASTDPYGFVVWLNGERVQRGLGPVTWDNDCAYNASINNQHQASRGLGHYHHVCRRQNAGMGTSQIIWPAWTTSKGHADALFDPTITRVGLHINGMWQTFNAN